MRKRLFAIVGLIVLAATANEKFSSGGAVGLGQTGNDQAGPVSLNTPRRAYLLGEPVVLRVGFKNVTGEDITAVEYEAEGAEPNIHLCTSKDNTDFARFKFGYKIAASGRPTVRTLKPGEVWDHEFRVLYSQLDGGKLAFMEPGTYYIKALYPLYLRGTTGAKRTESNVIAIEVTMPKSEDAEVWRQVHDPSFLTLLQSEEWITKYKEAPVKMAKLLRSHPNCGYASALRHTLARIYFRHRFGLPQEDQERFAQTLGITDVEALADERLNARRKDQLEGGTSLVKKETPLAKVLALLSEAGVPLDAAPELNDKKVNIGAAYRTVRLSMRTLSDELEASWERRGNGYFLVPFDAASNKRVKGKGDGGD